MLRFVRASLRRRSCDVVWNQMLVRSSYQVAPLCVSSRLLATRGPLAQRSVGVNDGVAAGRGSLVSEVDNRAPARTAGNARIHVAVSSHPDEREASAASRALHAWRKQMIPHEKLWHPFTPSPRASCGMRDNTAHRSSRCSALGCGGRQGARHRFGSGATRA
jgi:hypothetical protein